MARATGSRVRKRSSHRPHIAHWNRDPDFRNNRYPWLHNTLAALDSDVAEEIVIERGGAYFNEKDRTAAVWMPAIERMKFFKANHGEKPNDHEPDEESTQRQPALQSTMGMIAAMVNRSEDWLDDFLREQGSDQRANGTAALA